MSAQRLGAKALRRIEKDVGEPVLRGWSHGGYTFGFVTPDHHHGWWNKVSHEWGWEVDGPGPDHLTHYTSCSETWPTTVGS
jgi:hypothetical protein